MTPVELSIKSKIEKIGTPLKDWDVVINRGVLTGYNKAFIITEEKKDELINEDPKSAEIIRPILRGRDICRYGYNYADLWLIATFPSKNYDIDDYPAIKDYLLSNDIRRLEQSGKSYIIDGKEVRARKKTNNKWFETQDSINYWDDFSKTKIMYNDINQRLSFCLVEKDILCNNTVYFITENQHLKYLLACLNSRVIDWYYKTLSVQLGNNAVRMFNIYVENIPIPRVSAETEDEITQHVNNILYKKNSALDDDFAIDNIIYNLYSITLEEKEYINSFYDNKTIK